MSIAVLFFLCQAELYEPQSVLQFAEHLYMQEDFSAALNEYRRYLFLTDSDRQDVYESIIECLTQLGRYDEAVRETENIGNINQRNYTKGLIFFAAGAVD